MKTSLIWAIIAIASMAFMVGIFAMVRYNIKENKREYELARRRVEEQITAFRKVELANTENKIAFRVITHLNDENDNEWNVEERLSA